MFAMCTILLSNLSHMHRHRCCLINTAENARRVRQHKRRKQAKVIGSGEQQLKPLSWRQCCEETASESMMGDFRPNNSGKNNNMPTKIVAQYPFPVTMDHYYGEEDTTNNSTKWSETDDHIEVQQEMWKAILAFGQSIEKQLAQATSTTSGNNKDYDDGIVVPKLSLLTSFLNNAYKVRPVPEDIFRAPSVPPEINACMNNIMDHVDKARKIQAKLFDLLGEANHGGVDLDALQKLLDQTGRPIAVELDYAKEMYRLIDVAADWQKRLEELVSEKELSLTSLEELAQEGRRFVFRTRGLVQLESRIHKAYLLRDRIDSWKKVSTRRLLQICAPWSCTCTCPGWMEPAFVAPFLPY